jgi:hypothetical protein
MPNRSSLGRLAMAICVVSGALSAPGCGGSVPAPTAFKEYGSPSGRFACEYPEGWEATGAGKPDSPNSWAKFTKGSAEIQVEADLAGSLYADMARAGGGMTGENPEPPVAKIHPMALRQMKEDYSNYDEREAKTVQSKGLGEGRRSTFTATQSLGGKIYGYRATFISGDRRITVICKSPATNWQALKPAFERVIGSIRSG